jgi:DNA/RNA-binding domain of Phe-tRNA-synthetase-like protein
MQDEVGLDAARGSIAPELQAEFPGLRLLWVTAEARIRPSPSELKRRLNELSSRYRGEVVIAMRTQPIPHAFRAFFRQVGLDPDVTRIPAEAAAVQRLLHGRFESRNVVEDARLIAVIETGVPVWALDANLVDTGGLGIRVTAADDQLGSGEYTRRLAPGQLVIADRRMIHALLFDEVAPGHGVGRGTERAVLFAVGVEGVPAIHIEEALWQVAQVLRAYA